MTARNLVWCDRCGEALGGGPHPACRQARTLEPPRYCGECRRRMKVQVMPAGWRATCVEHGVVESVAHSVLKSVVESVVES